MTKKGEKEALKHIRLYNAGDNEWAFEYPRLTSEAMDSLDEGIDKYRSGDLYGAKLRFNELIKKFPEFIDAYHHLALTMDVLGGPYQSFNLVKDATDIGLSTFPQNFYFGRDLLPWLDLDNRPFLRVYHFCALKYSQLGETEKAVCIFNNILDMNPNDNQGARCLAVNCYLTLKRPVDVLRIVETYPEDMLAETLYGKVLALFQLDRIKEAHKALKEAEAALPLVAAEIAKKQHRKPKNLETKYITHGGKDEAYIYWMEGAKHWKETPGAIEFVREYLSKRD